MYGFYLQTHFLDPFVAIAGVRVHQFGQSVNLICIINGGGLYNFTWEAPAGSTSLERGIITNATSSSRLTFEAHEEDTGTFTCEVDPSVTGSPAMATVTVGNAFILFTIKTKVQYLPYSSRYCDGTRGHDSGV